LLLIIFPYANRDTNRSIISSNTNQTIIIGLRWYNLTVSEVYLASSALSPGFDGLETIKAAKDFGFDGAQLYLDIRYQETAYIIEALKNLSVARLGLIVHLPNVMTLEDLTAAISITGKHPGTKMLIHHLPAKTLPDIKGAVMGWENSVTGKHDPSHIEDTIKQSRLDGAFFAYDYGRSVYPVNKVGQKKLIDFVLKTIGSLRPDKDIIHIEDRTSWNRPYRDCACALGVGIWKELVDVLSQWPGVVVMEQEDLQQAVDSMHRLRAFS